MQTELGAPIQYYLVFKEDFVHLNTLLGRVINIDFHGYECLNCHEDKPIFRQGFCKNCFFDTPQAGDWIMRPELSKAHLGIEDREIGRSVGCTNEPAWLQRQGNAPSCS